MTLTYASVCSGIEAASVAWKPLGWTPKLFSEIEKFPSTVLAEHYGSNMPGEPLSKNGVPNYGDFTTISEDAGPVDLLVGGTPCQSFSIAGKRLGLDDPRGNLALEYLRLARRLRARWFVWENVPGILSSFSGSPESEDRRGPENGRREDADFATFLSFVRQCGYGFAYRVFDTQYVRVSGFERAIPQRRRRVILVGHIGDWRRAAAVLLEREGMSGHPPPRREAGKKASPTISARTSGGGGLGTDFDLDGGLVAADMTAIGEYGDGSTASTVKARDAKDATDLVAHTLLAKGNDSMAADIQTYVAHSLSASYDASEDGTGRGTPIVPIAFSSKDHGNDAIENVSPTLRAGGHSDSHANAGVPPAIAFAQNTRDEIRVFGGDGTVVGALAADPGMKQQSYIAEPFTITERGRGDGQSFEYRQDGTANTILTPNGGRGGMGVGAIASSWAVRRLTPIECERLQGFPDNFTQIPWRGKSAEKCPDGPRYKALGNSMSINVMRHIGERIDLFERLVEAEKIPPLHFDDYVDGDK